MRKLLTRLVLLLIVGTWVAASAQEEGTATGDVTVPVIQGGIGQEEAQQRIAELQSSTDVDEARRSRLIDLYRQLVQRIEAERGFLERSEAFRTAIDVAPRETAQLRAGLAAEKPAPETEPPVGSSEELNQQLTRVQAELTTLRTQQAELGRRISEEEGRATKALVAEAREALAQIEEQLAQTAPPGADATELQRVERALLQARQSARIAEIAMLENEELSRPARLDLLRARRDQLARRIAQTEARLTSLENRLAELRQEEAERARREAERLRQATLGKHPLIADAAAEIARTTRDTEELLPRITTTRERRNSLEERLEEVEADFEETLRSLDLGITDSLGAWLLELRRNLPDERTFQRAAAERSDEVAKTRERLFLLERNLKESGSETTVDALLAQADTEGLSAADLGDLRAELVTLLATKGEALTLLQGALRDYLSAIRDVEALERDLIERSRELTALLDEQLIWIPNAPPLGIATLKRLPAELAWLVSPARWQQSLEVIRADVRRQYGAWALVAVLAAGFLAARRRLRRPLEALAARVGKVRSDGILLTLKALFLQVLTSVPIPAAGVWVGWRLMAAKESTEASKAIGAGFVAAFSVLFAFQLLRNLCRADGVARAHFRWGDRTGRVVRKNLLWYLAFALPTTFVTALTQAQADRLLRYGIGRIAFITLMLAAVVLAYLLLNRSRGLFIGRQVERSSTWLRRSRPLWLPVGMGMPLALAVMAATGYYYAALQLEFRLNQTLFVILAAVFVHAFCLRWLMVSQRRLALRVALEKRAAQAKKSEAAEDPDALAAEQAIESMEEIDVVEIQDQTQDLLRISIGLVFAVAIWFAWSDVLPALAVLDEIQLWTHEVVVEGVSQQHPITLANLGLALLLILVTVAAARNMPGFLEIALLQRLPLDAGARYATRTLVLYAIASVGIVLAFNAIGVGWSSVQWLLAALTVGLGFGLQEIFANFVSGLILLLERPIRVGDTVTVGAVSGVVTRIRMRATTITDWSRRELLVPNKNFITGELINWSLSDPILRLEVPVGIAYGSDTALAHRTILQVCREHPLVLDQPEPNVWFVGFGDNSLNFDARVFVNETTNTGRSRIVHDLHMAIDQACREHDITIAFPQRDLHFKTSETVLRVALEGDPQA